MYKPAKKCKKCKKGFKKWWLWVHEETGYCFKCQMAYERGKTKT